jgi:transcription factor AP-2
MARDFTYVCETEFPSRHIAEYVCSRYQQQDAQEMQQRKDMIMATKWVNGYKRIIHYLNCYSRSVLKELVDLLNQDRSPLCNSRPQPLLDPSIQRHLTHFSLITHGFGSPAIVSAMQVCVCVSVFAPQRCPHAGGERVVE